MVRVAVPLVEPRDGVPDPVTTAAGLAAAVDRLAAGTGPVAVDAERASGYRYGQRAYLVQLRRRGAGTVLIDPVPLPDLSGLGAALADTEWVLHAASQDLPCLSELGLHPRVLFDTELAGRLLGYEKVGLGAMVESQLGLTLEKGHSAADWSTRPLPRSWLVYAALDVEVLVELRDLLEDAAARRGQARVGPGGVRRGGRRAAAGAAGRALAADVRDPPGPGPAGAGDRTVAVGGAGRARPPARHRPRPGAAGQRDRRGRDGEPGDRRGPGEAAGVLRPAAAAPAPPLVRRGRGGTPRCRRPSCPCPRCPRTRRRRRTAGPTATRTPPPGWPPPAPRWPRCPRSTRSRWRTCSPPTWSAGWPGRRRPRRSPRTSVAAVLASGRRPAWQVALAATPLARALTASAPPPTDPAADRLTADPLTADPLTADPLTADPVTADPRTSTPVTVDPAVDPAVDSPVDPAVDSGAGFSAGETPPAEPLGEPPAGSATT